MTWGNWYWPVFLIISAIWIITGFGVPEIIALITEVKGHTDNTLSHYSQFELGMSTEITRHSIAWVLSLLSWVVITTLLTWHIWFRLGG